MTRQRVFQLAGILGLSLTVIASAGCGGGSSKSEGPGDTTAPSQVASAAPQDTSAGGGLSDSINKFGDVKSYKFTMTMKGGTYGKLLGGQPITGIIVLSPEKAVEMNLMGMTVRQVGGKTYIKMLDAWVESTDNSTTSMADSYTPQKMFGSYLTPEMARDYNLVGEEQKNGLVAFHYQGVATAMTKYGEMLGVSGGTWSSDIWVAKDGGYPISMMLKNTGGSSDFLFSMDITNINDPTNVVTAPI